MAQSNMYSTSAADVWEIFCDHVEGNPAAVVLALSWNPLGDASRNALAKSFESLGYGKEVCAFATILPRSDAEEARDLQALALDPQALFMLVEGLDPVCLVCADGETAKVLGAAYRTSFKTDAATRVFGRPAAVFRSLDALMESPEGKRSAWAVLKTFPKRA